MHEINLMRVIKNTAEAVKIPLLGALMMLLALTLAATAYGQIKVSGYVKFDAIFDLDELDPLDLYTGVAAIDGSDADKVDGGFHMHARQTRIRFTTDTDTDAGKVKTYIEGDFFGVGGTETITNGHALRLRHAWGSVGPWLFGQNWTNFMADLIWSPEIMDFAGPAGEPFIRAPQIRLTFPVGTGGSRIVLSAENPNSTIFENKGANPATGSNAKGVDPQIPDLIARYHLVGGFGQIAFLGLVRTIRAADGVVDYDEDTTAAALAVTGKFHFGGESNLQFWVSGGEPGRYNFFTVAGGKDLATGDAFITSTGTVEAIESIGALVALQIWVTKSGRVNLVFGMTDVDIPNELADNGLVETLSTIHVNYVFNATKSVKFGFELINQSVDFDAAPGDPDSGDKQRAQFSAQFNF